MNLPINRCPVCETTIRQARTGRRRIYCSNRCRQVAKRERRIVCSLKSGSAPEGGPVAAFLVGRSAPVDDQVLAAVHEVILLIVTFRRLGGEARRQFAWRCLSMADALEAALSEYFRESP